MPQRRVYDHAMKGNAEAIQKFAVTVALAESGIALMRQNLRRRNGQMSDVEIDRELQAWLERREDAIPGDVAGPVRIRSIDA